MTPGARAAELERRRVQAGVSVRPDRGVRDAVESLVGLGAALYPVAQRRGGGEAEVVVAVGWLLICAASFGVAGRTGDRVARAVQPERCSRHGRPVAELEVS